VLVRLLEARSFRNLDHAEAELADGITLIHGPNGAGKTNLLEALCFGLTASSWRTRADRELIGFGAPLARAELTVIDGAETRRFLASATRADGRTHRLNGNPVPDDVTALRPAVAIFSPDRLALIKGPPTERRGHVDRFIAALWPARADVRRRFGRALAQRNALLGRIRAGGAAQDALDAWDAEFATEAAALIEARAAALERLAPSFGSLAGELGLSEEATLRYRPRVEGSDPAAIVAELRERRASDVERGHSTHGPHLDEVEVALGGRAVRRYGSQGQQRTALLALLFAEREALLEARRTPPVMLLDDVMSELDPDRRLLLVELLRGEGQAVITATEASQVPDDAERAEIEINHGRVTLPIGATARAA
jgi:DNA replication and repair protein RecF